MRRDWMVGPRCIGLVGAMTMLGGCFGLFDDDHRGDPPEQDRTIYVAVGAEVQLRLELVCSFGVDDVGVGCLSENPSAVVDVSLSETRAFAVGDAEVGSLEILADVEALAPGGATLTVTYLDVFGDEVVDHFELRAAELTRVELEAPCRVEFEPGEPLPISAGAELDVILRGFADERRLATGDLPLVTDADGLDLDAAGHLTAPASAGTHVVTLAGQDSVPTTFVVYSPADVEVALSEGATISGDDIVPSVEVLPRIAGGPACVFDGSTLAHVWIGEGDCAPALGGFALDGPVPIDLGDAELALPLRGQGTCEVLAAVEGGTPSALSIEVDAPFGAGNAWDEERLSDAPLVIDPPMPVRTECELVEDLSRGGCHILDAAGIPLPSLDCLRKWDWTITHRDADYGDGEIETNLVGAGLRSELLARIDYEVLLLDAGSYPPSELVASASPASGLVAYADGCVDEDHAVVVLEHDVAGTYDVTLSAANINHSGSVEVRVRDVGAVRFETGATDVIREGDVTRAHVFTGVATELGVGYEDADGVELGGWGSFSISTSDPDARAAIDRRALELHTGTLPHVIRLASDVAPSIYELDVVDGDAVAAIEGIGDPTLSAGETECITPTALAADGLEIHGRSSIPPRLTIDGSALVVDPDGAWPDDELCLRARAPGESSLEVRWGALTEPHTWSVQ